MAESITIIEARPEQIDTITAILDEATLWVESRGGRQWPRPFPRERLTERFATGQVYLAWRGDDVVGTFSLQPSDELFWGDTPPDALYLHGLAIRRIAGGQGVGRQLVAWSEQRVREVGRRYLRLDCQGGNEAIQRYYRQLGFVDRGGVTVRERPYRLMEKDVLMSQDETRDAP
jgi:GNAT superfamily N-acetyltransferase